MSDAEIMATAGLADAALQVAGNITASTFNYEHTKELAKWQNDMNVQNWKMANEYNTPANQMKRFEAAGLNPNLIYGQGTPGNAGTVAAASAPSHNEIRNPFAGVELAGMYQQVKNAALQGQSQSISNSEKMLDLVDKSMQYNAWQLFSYDHIKGTKSRPYYVTVGKNGALDLGELDFKYEESIRNSPYYKKLDLMWQKGELNESNIGLIGAKKNVLGFSEEKSTLLRDIMQGDMSGDSLKKVITLILINLLESSTSSSVLSTILK